MVSLLQSLYEQLGIAVTANVGDVAGFISMLSLFVAGLFQYISSPGKAKEISQTTQKVDEIKEASAVEEHAEVAVVEEPAEPVSTVSWAERLKNGLSSSRGQVWGKLGNIFSSGSLSEDQLEEIEELLYSSDIGPSIAAELTEALEKKASDKDFKPEDFKSFLKTFLSEKLDPIQVEVDEDLFTFTKSDHTKVVMIVGVNGAGKTTTIGKLATKLTAQGANVVVGACDTFRAAAVDQLQVWCDRAGATMIRAKEGAGPSGVGYEALEKAISMKADYCLLDTAGRLHTKENLMDELEKSKNVLKKLDPNAPGHVLLVIDAITGQNAIRQAEEFNKTLGLTGLILTKCDGSSKAGSAVSIVQSLKVPITYIGVGESVDDINRFNTNEYLDALLDL